MTSFRDTALDEAQTAKEINSGSRRIIQGMFGQWIHLKDVKHNPENQYAFLSLELGKFCQNHCIFPHYFI